MQRWMRAIVVGVVLALACRHDPQRSPRLSAPFSLEDDLQCARHTPRGGDADLAERNQAIGRLLANADAAYPRLLADLRAGRDLEGTLAIIGLFDRADSIPALERLLVGESESLRGLAAVALGRQSQIGARERLLRALSDPDTRLAALDGLRVTGDAAVAPQVRAVLDSDDAEVRWMALHTLVELGAATREELARMATDDDEHVRELAESALQQAE